MSERSDDEQLLARWRGGDAQAGAALFERYYEAIARFFVNKVGLDCGDLVQATFLGCLEGLERFRGEASFRTLLFAIAR
ncbi:MAG: sigma-70 family RNA polymerase sigma factor, partial [Myxococcales bacterium]|nr:sigma-70 family RNA polymerase sigma factor [Myxococcales bacterium]